MLVLLVKENIKSWITLEDKEVKLTCKYLIICSTGNKNKPLHRKYLVKCDIAVV